MTAQLSLFDQPVRQPIVAAVPSPVRSRGPVLRDYQSECVAAVRRELAEAVSTLVVMATGTGKTVTFGEVAATWPTGNVLVVAHRQELIWQAVDKIKRATGREPDVEMAELRASGRGRVVVSSVQTLSSGDRLARFDPHDFGLVVVDEAHHAPANSYGRILAHFRQNPELRILGVTATPDRHDEAALGRVFATVAYQYELPDAIADGWLVEPRQHFVHVEGLDLSRVRTTAGDLNEGDVATIIQEDRNLYGIVQPTLEIAGDRPVLFFAPSVEAAKKMADIVNAQRPGQALCIHGGTPTDERRRGLADFERGRHQYLCGCGVFLEGFDSPRIAVVAMARPTKSRALYAQAVGRGTRPIEPPMEGTPDERRASIAFSSKPFLDVIDFVGNAGRHKLISTADILGGNYEDDVVEAAAAAVKAAGSGEMREALAKAEADKRKREDEARRLALRRAIDAKATYRLEAVDPFDVFDLRAPREPGWHKGRTATDRQREALVKFGVPEKTAEALSFVKASALMDKMIQRRRDGLCTYKQAKFLRSHGIDGAAVTFERASELFDAIKANGWKKPEGLEP